MYFGEISQANLVKSNSERIVLYIFEQFFPLKTNRAYSKELLFYFRVPLPYLNEHLKYNYEKSSFVCFWATKWEASPVF